MAKRIFSFCLYGIAFVITGLLFCFQLRYFASVPDATEFHMPADSNTSISVKNLQNLQDKTLVTGASTQRGRVWTMAGRSADGLFLYTDRFYKSIYPLPMKYGYFWTNSGVVISDQLAEQLFLSEDCIGAELFLSTGIYRVTGVFHTNRDFISLAVPQADIILPFTTEAATVEMIAFPGGKPESYYLSAVHDSEFDTLSTWISMRLHPEAGLLLMFDQWVLLLIWLLCSWQYFQWLIQKGRLFQSNMRISLQIYYGKRALWDNKEEGIKLLSSLLLYLILTGGILYAVTYSIKLPANVVISNVFSRQSWMSFLGERISLPRLLSSPDTAVVFYRNIWASIFTLVVSLVGTVLFLWGKLVKKKMDKKL